VFASPAADNQEIHRGFVIVMADGSHTVYQAGLFTLFAESMPVRMADL
jgi:hypothetical protein